jgi:hypothetical protein
MRGPASLSERHRHDEALIDDLLGARRVLQEAMVAIPRDLTQHIIDLIAMTVTALEEVLRRPILMASARAGAVHAASSARAIKAMSDTAQIFPPRYPRRIFAPL